MTANAIRLKVQTFKNQNAATIDWRVLLAVAITVVSWASAFPAIRAGLQAYSPEHVALLRYLFASAALAVVAVITRLPLPQLRDVPGIMLTGFLGVTVYNLLLNSGETGVPAAVASFIVASAPIYMALFATLLFKERLRQWGWIGILISFSGVALISVGTGAAGGQISPQVILVVLAPIAQSYYSIAQKPYLKRYSTFQFTAYALWSAAFFLLAFLPGLFDEIKAAPISATLAVAYLGLFPGALAYGTWAYAMARIPASRAGSFLYMIPLVAMIISWLWLGELPTLLSLVGGLVVLTGVIVVNTRGKVPKPKDV
jgi:drug/metabolite transporter (DMT)-like permease